MKEKINILFLVVIALFVCIVVYPIVHELGHVIIAKLLGIEVVGVSIFPYSILCSSKELSDSKEIAIALGGLALPIVICLFEITEKFFSWYMLFIFHAVTELSILIEIIIIYLNRKGIVYKNDDMTIILEINNKIGLYLMIILTFIFIVLFRKLVKKCPCEKIYKKILS